MDLPQEFIHIHIFFYQTESVWTTESTEIQYFSRRNRNCFTPFSMQFSNILLNGVFRWETMVNLIYIFITNVVWINIASNIHSHILQISDFVFGSPGHRISIFRIFFHQDLHFQKNYILFCVILYSLGPPSHVVQIKGAALSKRSLKNVHMYIFPNFIFPKLHFHIPSIFTTLFSCELKWEGKPTQKKFQSCQPSSELVKRSNLQPYTITSTFELCT